jgi:hypothetical protein
MAPESSQVVSYVPKQLYDCLEQLKDERGLHSVSQAVNAILVDYFGLDSWPTITNQPLTQLVEDLRGEVAALKKQVSQLEQTYTSNQTDQLTGLKSQSELLNQKQLAERLGVDTTIIEQHKTDGKEFTEWSRSKDPDHSRWKYAEADLFRQI